MIFLKSLIIAIIFSLLPIRLSAADLTPGQLVQEYFLAIKAQDWTGAESYWDKSYIESTKRLGINYQNISVKYDCASPLVLASAPISDGLVTLAIDSISETFDGARIEVMLKTRSDTASVTYFSILTVDGWKLTSPAELLTRDWNRLTTRYLNLYFSDSSRINDDACRAADNFIESTGKLLGLSESEMTKLAKQKIDYYLCDKDEIKEITGYNEAGMTDLPSDAIISQYFPHNHELAHLLVNYASPGIPLYTQPFLQEGLACHLGGRWGRAPNVIKYSGNATLEFDVVELEQILSYDGFKNQIGMPDISYPVSSLFVGYLIETVGMEEFLELYRQFSGDNVADLFLQSESRMITALENLLGKKWDEIKTDINTNRKQFRYAGIKPPPSGQNGAVDYFVQGQGMAVSIYCTAAENIFDIIISDQKKSGTIIFSSLDSLVEKYHSQLFVDHHAGATYDGGRYGLRFSPVEVSLYDYRCNNLIATFSTGFSPNETICDSAKLHLRFAIDKTIFDKTVFDKSLDSFAISIISP